MFLDNRLIPPLAQACSLCPIQNSLYIPTQHYCALPPSLLERGNGGEDSAGVPNSKFRIQNSKFTIPLALFRGNRSQCLFYNILGFFGRTFAFPTLTKCRYEIGAGFASIVQPVPYAILHILCLVSFQFI